MEIPQTYEVRYRVRFDEAGADGQLRPSGFLRYAQDVAWQHSEAAGFDRAWYDSRGTFWLVRSVELRVDGGIGYGETVAATTRVTGWRRVWARRHTTFDDTAGHRVAEAKTDWVLLNREGRPSRIPVEISSLLAAGSTYRPEKVEIPAIPPTAERQRVRVRAADVDPLGHLNNAAYLDMVDEAFTSVDAAPAASAYRAEFIRPAPMGTQLEVAAWRVDDGRMACRISDEADAEVFRALVSRSTPV